LEIKTDSQSEKKKIETDLSVGGISWSTKAKVEEKLERISRDYEIEYKVIKNGSNSPAPDSTPLKIIAAAQAFPREVQNKDGAPWVRSVTTVSYEAILDRPDGELVDLERQGWTLEDIAEWIDFVHGKLKTVDAIIQHPSSYEDIDRTRLYELKEIYEGIRETLVRAGRECGLNPNACVMPEIDYPVDRLPDRKTRATRSVVDLMVRTQSNQGVPANKGKVTWHPLDLNIHHGGKYIYVGCTKDENGKPVREIGFISGKKELNRKEVETAMKKKGFEHCSGQDLNKGAGGRYIYMGWSKQSSKAPITGVDFVETHSKKAPHKNGWNLIPQDLCEGAGSSYIWCYLKRESKN
jgi:hypothetical protein